MFSVRCVNGNRKVICCTNHGVMKRSRKKGKVKREEAGENEKTKKKGKSSRKARKKIVIQSGTVYIQNCSFFRHGIQGQVFHLLG